MVAADHTFSLVHKPGAQNPADAPSRYPLPSVGDPSGARMDRTGHNGSFADAYELPPETNQPAAMWLTERLSAAAQRWVSAAVPAQPTRAAPLPGALRGEPDAFGVCATQQLCTQPVAFSFFPAAAQGVVLLEPFGGLCAGLEMLLRNGTAVKHYYYLDSNATSRKVAAHQQQRRRSLGRR
ncbi:hypothetical protein COO60DRAFT_1164663 [Scenedesmus sp. NREL 46B-D3]|nr:hypothetical protein COO60DRAFT_1164663 [Scenedesmus sp. NREL 46B-D3]